MTVVRRRPRNGPHRRLWLNVTVSAELMAEIDEAALRAGLAKGAWVRELIEDTLGLDYDTCWPTT